MPAGTQLDLGATAKAGAADRCARLVHETLGTGVLVSLGGDIATAGEGPEGGWQVTVQDLPDDAPQQISLTDGAAVATSSTAKRIWDQAGHRRHHLVDPRTGLPCHGRLAQRERRGPHLPAGQHRHHGRPRARRRRPRPAWSRSGLPARLVPHDGAVVTLNGWPPEDDPS